MTDRDEPRQQRVARERKAVLLRLDPAVHDALARWAADDLRSVNAQIDKLLRDALAKAGRTPSGIAPPRPRGRPRTPGDSAE
ncbi:hypothetical protein Xcel_1975 [Xylanimonas cellulosilytica DSM 15894]|uniref:Arc-like DNA binding domain-containing protein n=1 Tax=Xylanimonas cellulosilytica (strain DSM 15894 / JCM 12276 / CECT 5975 / KCTC 9989 / LMG 20990 / NBRC 107835 / XIL07) TaxID=446471 RepID=D1BTL5_XYLCX|nr:hypothetical protein [Xylanimonas cellulosilytica]ACZ30994.1 hypothetical protein Xcel_1975 [Xylanimonas cellulosilytica DSM 15894]